MSKLALIITGTGEVCQVETTEFPVPSSMQWVSCPDATTPEDYIYNGTAVVTKASMMTLAEAQTAQIATIKAAFQSATLAPVTDANSVTWSGGKDSANTIFLACQLAQETGATNVTLYDEANTAHTMTIADGMTVAATIGGAYQTAYQKWQTLRAEVMAATTVADVQAVVW